MGSTAVSRAKSAEHNLMGSTAVSRADQIDKVSRSYSPVSFYMDSAVNHPGPVRKGNNKSSESKMNKRFKENSIPLSFYTTTLVYYPAPDPDPTYESLMYIFVPNEEKLSHQLSFYMDPTLSHPARKIYIPFSTADSSLLKSVANLTFRRFQEDSSQSKSVANVTVPCFQDDSSQSKSVANVTFHFQSSGSMAKVSFGSFDSQSSQFKPTESKVSELKPTESKVSFGSRSSELKPSQSKLSCCSVGSDSSESKSSQSKLSFRSSGSDSSESKSSESKLSFRSSGSDSCESKSSQSKLSFRSSGSDSSESKSSESKLSFRSSGSDSSESKSSQSKLSFGSFGSDSSELKFIFGSFDSLSSQSKSVAKGVQKSDVRTSSGMFLNGVERKHAMIQFNLKRGGQRIATMLVYLVTMLREEKLISQCLKVLEWWRYPSEELPSDFDSKKLVICKLPNMGFMSPDLTGDPDVSQTLDKIARVMLQISHGNFQTEMAWRLVGLMTSVVGLSLYSFFYDKAVNGKPETLSIVSNAAFALVSLSLDKLVRFGVEIGCFAVQLVTINWMLIFVAIFFGCPLFVMHSSINSRPVVYGQFVGIVIGLGTLLEDATIKVSAPFLIKVWLNKQLN
ncbi:hypothetical protein RYX36_017527 [Vicia faba]